MNYKNFEELVKRYLNGDKNLSPLFIEGESGIGKSQIIRQVAEACKYSVFVVQIGTKTLEYFMGLPETVEVNGSLETKWTPPELVSLVNNCEGPALVFIDDFHLSREEERKVMFELLTDNAMHGFKLKDGTKIILAANPHSAEYGSTSSELPKPIRSRVMLFELNANFDQWKEVSLENSISPLIVSFLTFNKECFLSEPGKNGQYPCPRAWWSLSNYLKAGFELTSELVCAAVGNTASAEFLAFYNIYLSYERKKPDKWLSLDYKEKAAFISYLMIKKDANLIKRYHKEIKSDEKSRPLSIVLWKFLAFSKEESLKNFFDKEVPIDILKKYAIA